MPDTPRENVQEKIADALTATFWRWPGADWSAALHSGGRYSSKSPSKRGARSVSGSPLSALPAEAQRAVLRRDTVRRQVHGHALALGRLDTA